ncbi:membrane protein [Streptomyces uncialis]|uniref:Membrane protein n=1 Tax=Streptomyces uncialis TaxID=1048205 RepID=A0A1Q4VE42_9ACTN|nr:membrane protein [Streptomyces uncialis]
MAWHGHGLEGVGTVEKGQDLTWIAYLVYIVVSIGLTVWVARTLSRNGRIFLSDVLRGNERLADAVNHLLVVGFYLINLGFVALYLTQEERITEAREVFEALSTKLGVVLLVLGVLHLGNVWVLNKIRRRGIMEREQLPPVPPQEYTGNQGPWAPPTAKA